MQSIIISFFYRFIASLWMLFKKSGTYRLFDRIYQAVSNAWTNSAIVAVFKRDADTDTIAKTSVLYKILNAPFAFMGFLRDKIGGWLKNKIDSSCFIYAGRVYMQNLFACNIRFIGVMILASGLSYTVCKLLFMEKGVGKLNIALILMGVVFSLFDWNATGFLRSSKVTKFILDITGFEIHFDFYKKRHTQGLGRLIIAAAVGLVSGVLFTKSILFGIALPIGLFGMCAVLYAPVIGVFFAVFAAPFVPTMVLALLCILTMASLMIQSIIVPYFKWRFDGVGLGMLLLLVMLLVSSITSFAPLNSVSVWLMYLVFMGFYFAIINTVKSKKQLFALLKVFVIAGAFVALYGILQYAFGWNTNNAWIDETMFENDTMRVYSTLENPNVLGEYLLLVLPVAAVFMCQYKLKQLPKWVYMAITVILFGCLILTQSRGCWLGFLLGIVVFVTFTNGRLWGILPVVIAVLPFVLPQTIVERLLSIGNMNDSSTSYRVFIWFGTLAMLKHFWIGGIGLGERAFNSVYPFYSYNAIIAPHSHNLYLQLITESGISALLIFIIVMIVFIKKMIIVYDCDKRTSMNSMMSIAFISGLLGFLLQSMFDYTFYNYRVMAMFFMFMAMGMALKYITAGTVKNKGGN